MNEQRISSASNERLKRYRSLQQRRAREQHGLYLVEGIKLVEEALKCSCTIEALILDHDKADTLKNRLNIPESLEVLRVESSLFTSLTGMVHSEGVIGVLQMPKDVEVVSERLLLLDGIRDPGNMGTILRSAEAFGYHMILTIHDCVDVFNPKVVRSAMGSLFRIHVQETSIEKLFELERTGYTLICTGFDTEQTAEQLKGISPHVLVIGSESHGVNEEIESSCSVKVKIPMEGEVESLNAGVAASILMYCLK